MKKFSPAWFKRFITTYSWKQQWNALKYWLFKDMKWVMLPYNPVKITLVIESNCNQQCQMCVYHSQETTREKTPLHLSLEDFKKEIDILANAGVMHCHLCSIGEVFFNPHLFDMIKYAKSKKMSVSLLTNGSKIMTPHIKRIIDAGLNSLFVSIDSGDPKQFEEIRVGASWNDLKNNMQMLSEERNKAKSSMKIGAWCIAMKSNANTYSKLVKECAEMGIDSIMYSYLIPIGLSKHTSPNNRIKKEDTEIIEKLKQSKKLGDKLGVHVDFPPFPKNIGHRVDCRALWGKLMINLPNPKLPKDKWIGNASSHCFLPIKETAITYGNILHQPFNEVWNGKELRDMRRKVLFNPPKVCRECPNQ